MLLQKQRFRAFSGRADRRSDTGGSAAAHHHIGMLRDRYIPRGLVHDRALRACRFNSTHRLRQQTGNHSRHPAHFAEVSPIHKVTLHESKKACQSRTSLLSKSSSCENINTVLSGSVVITMMDTDKQTRDPSDHEGPQKESITMRMSHVAGTVALVCASVAGLLNAAEAATGQSTLENLQAAFNGESNAKAKYEAFAVKADEEGYKSVAALFRATSLSEGIHAKKHAAVIAKLGAEPKATVGKPDVKSTKENLEAALAGESYEKTTMYPEFIKLAQSEKNKAAVRTFRGAMLAEVEHAKLYQQALNELDAWKTAGKEFLVCDICGYTALLTPDLKKCPVCSAPRSKFTTVK